MLKRGEISKSKVDQWERETKGKKLPERLKKINLVPVWEISTEKTTETIQDAEGKAVGFSSKITKVSTVRLYPDDLSKKEVDKIAVQK